MTHRILVLGASGPTGRLIVERALELGHAVTALSRHPGSIATAHPGLTRVMADVAAEPSAVASAMAGHDVVVCALGVGRRLRSGNLMTEAAPAIVRAMKQAGIQRLVFISALGVGGTAPHVPLIFRVMFRVMLSDIYADKAAAEVVIQDSGLQWTILAPVLLTNGKATGRYRLTHGEPRSGPWQISRADVAAAVVQTIDDPNTVGKRLVVGH